MAETAVLDACMQLLVRSLAVALSVGISLAAFGEDHQNAEKQARRITAMTADVTGRRMVSMSMADHFKVLRADLVGERRSTGIDYGSLFVAHELIANGASMVKITSALKSGKNIWQLGDEQHTNWKQIAGDAKKMNTEIDVCIYRHFLGEKHSKADEERDLADRYDVLRDGAKSDSNVSQQEIAEAQERYVFWRDRAGELSARRLGMGQEMAARVDHARGGGPRGSAGSTSSGTQPPAMGGLPPY
jgi:hypothetical protein